MFLIVVDAHTQWPKIVEMRNTTVATAIATMRSLFPRIGLQLLFGRNRKSRLDLLKPNVKRVVDSRLLQNETKRLTSYQAGEEVWLRNYRGGSKWLPGRELERMGPVLYRVLVDGTV